MKESERSARRSKIPPSHMRSRGRSIIQHSRHQTLYERGAPAARARPLFPSWWRSAVDFPRNQRGSMACVLARRPRVNRSRTVDTEGSLPSIPIQPPQRVRGSMLMFDRRARARPGACTPPARSKGDQCCHPTAPCLPCKLAMTLSR